MSWVSPDPRREPERVVCDRELTLLSAIERVWPQAEFWICEWHLRTRPAQLLYEYGFGEDEPIVQALERAFQSEAGREELKRLARGLRRRELEAWLRHNQSSANGGSRAGRPSVSSVPTSR